MNKTGIQLQEESFAFALQIVKLAHDLSVKQKDRVLSRQVLKSGTSIGANIREAQFAQTKADFITKLTISLKEASETQYWLDLLNKSDMIDDKVYSDLRSICDRLVGTLVNVVKSAKRHQ